MNEFLSMLNGGQLIGLIAVVLGPIAVIITVIASQWRRVRIAELEATLKQQMLDKGMSAAEIEQVMRSGNDGGEEGKLSSTGNEALDKAALTQRMIDNGYEGEDIERVLRAYQPAAKQIEEKPLVNRG